MAISVESLVQIEASFVASPELISSWV